MTATAGTAAAAEPVSATRHAGRLTRAAGLYGVPTSTTRPSPDVVRVLATADNGDRLTVEFIESRGNPSGHHTCTRQATTSTADDPSARPLRASMVIGWIRDHATALAGSPRPRRS